jgi:predicted SAM-dependent methyltransferase
MQQSHREHDQSDTTIAAIIAQFIKALAEIFTAHPETTARVALKRAEDDHNAAAEAAIQSKYAGAWYRRKELHQRAAAHRVAFSLSAMYEHQAAILDFLDDPFGPTPLAWHHTT